MVCALTFISDGVRSKAEEKLGVGRKLQGLVRKKCHSETSPGICEKSVGVAAPSCKSLHLPPPMPGLQKCSWNEGGQTQQGDRKRPKQQERPALWWATQLPPASLLPTVPGSTAPS